MPASRYPAPTAASRLHAHHVAESDVSGVAARFPRPALFHDTNVIRISPSTDPVSESAAELPPSPPFLSRKWDRVLPPAWNLGPAGASIERSVVYSYDEDALSAAASLAKSFGVRLEAEAGAVRHLAWCMSAFREILGPGGRFRAKIVASRGPRQSARCPRFHVDYVPLRMLVSLHGPGVVVCSDDAVDREAVNDIDVGMSDAEANRMIAPGIEKGPDLEPSAPGEAVLLVGRGWEGGGVVAAVHKSPVIHNPFLGRVLLSIDVVDD